MNLRTCRVVAALALLTNAALAAQTPALCTGRSPIVSAGGDTAKRVAALIAAGRTAFEKKDYEVAADSFKKATEADPNSAEAFLLYGNALGQRAVTASTFNRVILAPKMKKAWERSLELDPCNIEAHLNLSQFYEMAPGIAGGDKEKAKVEAKAVLALDPYRGEMQLGGLAQEEKDLPTAEAAYARAAQMPADTTGRAFGLWVFVLEDQRKFTPAFAAIDARLAKRPGDLVALTLLGRASAMSGERLAEGLAALKQVAADSHVAGFRISPAGMHYRMGQILAQQGDAAGAMAEYDAGLAIDPKNKLIKAAIEQLEQGRKN